MMRAFKRVTLLILSGLAIGLGAAALIRTAGDGTQTEGEIVRADGTYIADFRDDRRLVGAVDNVFIGRVVSQTGTAVFDAVPETQFSVYVQETIKGSLRGTIAVNQEGGKNGDQFVLFDDDPLLKPGQTYLFATRHYAERGWQTLVPRFGDILISDAAQRAALVERFTRATKEQISYTPE